MNSAKLLKPLAALVVFALFQSFAHAQCTCNGGNQLPITNPRMLGTAGNMPNFRVPTGWSSSGPAGLPDVGHATFNIDCTPGVLSPSCEGGNFCRMVAGTGISQTVSGMSNNTDYWITFSQALLLNWGRSTGHFDVTFCGTTISGPTLGLPAVDPRQTAWQIVTLGPFRCSGPPSTTLDFRSVSDFNGTVVGSLPLPCSYSKAANSCDLQLDGISICDGPPVLPVDLVAFKAQVIGSEVELFWQTGWERQNAHFIIERSLTGSHWSVLGKVEGAGESQQAREYRFRDDSPNRGTSLYRLRQTDLNGRVTYSEIREVRLTEEGEGWTLYPNPAGNAYTVDLGGLTASSIDLFDVQHRQVTARITEEGGKYQIATSNLAKGLYFVRLRIEDQVEVRTIVVGGDL